MAGDFLLVDSFRLIAVVPLNVRAALGGQDALRRLEDPVGADIPHHGEDHVGGGVEGLVAVVEGLGGDLGDALHRPGDGDAAGVADVESLEQLLVDLPVGVILHHADLLGDDAPLLVHALLGEVGDGDEAEEDLQVLLKVLRAVEVVARHGAGGEGVGLGAVFRQVLHGAAVPGVEHLVLQIVGDAGGGVPPGAVQAETGVHPAVAGGEEGVFPAVAGFGDHTDGEAVPQLLPLAGFPDALVKRFPHALASFRSR